MIFLLLFLIISTVRSVEIQNCCPRDFSLTKIINGNESHRPEQYKCSFENDTSTRIHGIRLAQDNLVNIPQCEIQNFVKLSEEIHLDPHNSCVAKYQNNIYAITCPIGQHKNHLFPLNLIRKCCPFGKVYSQVKKQCITNENYDVNIFNRFFNSLIVFSDEQLKCPQRDEVIVEYFSHFHDFQFDGSSLKLMLNHQSSKNDDQITYSFSANTYCLDVLDDRNDSDTKIVDNKNIEFMVRTCNRPRICNRIPCVRRCCDKIDHKIIRVNGSSQCVPNTEESDLSIQFHRDGVERENGVYVDDFVEPKAYGVFYGQNCKKYKLNPDNENEVHYISHIDGSLHLPEETVDHLKYCIEKYESANGQTQMIVFKCFEDPESDRIKFNLYSVGIIISCCFFLLTLLTYLLIPKLRNLPGKILICLVLSLLIAYSGIAFGQLAPLNNELCDPFAYFIYFTSMMAFSWMNVMCFDIWLTFGSTERTRGMPFQRNEMKRFLLYSLYAVSVPSVLTLITVCIIKYELISEDLQPKFGEGHCWFQMNHLYVASYLVFFLCPIGVLFLINFVLFILTLKYCNRVKREIHRMQSSCDEKPIQKNKFIVDRARFMMNAKLFVVMGITWLLEIISTIFYNRTNMFFWIASDIFNVLQGVLVFFIFVFKWRVWNAILDRFGIQKGKRRLGATTTGGTTSTFAGSSGNLNNLMRMKSMESCSSLNVNALNSTKRPISP